METIKINNEILSFNKIWYVDSTKGDDTTGDGSKLKPFNTISKIYTLETNTKDAICLLPSNTDYNAEHIKMDTVNTPSTIIGKGLNTKLAFARIGGGLTWSKNLTMYSLVVKGYAGNLIYVNKSITVSLYNVFIDSYDMVEANGNQWKSPTFEVNASDVTFNFINCTGHADVMVMNAFSNVQINENNCVSLSGWPNFSSGYNVNYYSDSVYWPKPTVQNCLKNAAWDSSYNITDGTWKNVGDSTIKDVDGNRSSVGVYGGPYAWSNSDSGDSNGTKLLFLTTDGLRKYTTSWESVVGDWSTMTDVQKKALFESDGMDNLPSAVDLSQLGKYKILRYSGDTAAPTPILKITAVPVDRLFIPKKLIPINTLAHFKKAELTGTFSGQGSMHLLVTNDLLTYMTWDGTSFKNCVKVSQDGTTKQKWVSDAWVDTDYAGMAAHVKANGISPETLKSIPQTSWDTLIVGKAGYGFAYLPTIEASTDVCTNDKITITIIKNGRYRQAVHPTEYDVEYDTQDHVILKQSGDWEILYIK